MLTAIVSILGQLATATISYLGYGGVFILMAMESMVIPLPSELVLPFVGFLIASGRFSFLLAILFAALGSLAGSLLSYYIGKYGGRPLISRYGKYLLLDEKDLEKTEKWFLQKGEGVIFISRFIPVVRHLISIPAGAGKMNLKKFCIYTIVGAAIWNTFLIYLGYILGTRWEEVRKYSEYISIAVTILIIIELAYFIYRHIRNKRKI